MNRILQPDQNQSFSLPCFPPEKLYVRTGVDADGSCFFHAFLRATSTQYKHADAGKRREAVTQMRQRLADEVRDDTIPREVRKMLFMVHLRAALATGFPRDEHGEILARVIDLDRVLDETQAVGNFYLAFVEQLQRRGQTALGAAFARLEPYAVQWCYDTFHAVNARVLDDFKHRLLHEHIGAAEIGYIAQRLECNFLFVTEEGIYPFAADVNAAWPYVVLLWLEDHYEVVGEMNADRSVKRKFRRDDPLVQSINEQRREGNH